MTAGEIESVLREMWDGLGRTIAEYAHLDRLTIKGPDPRIEIEGLEHANAALASGKGILFVSGHFANWEVMPIAAEQCGVEGSAVYRPLNNPFVDRWMVGQRLKNGPKMQIAKGPQGTRRIFTLLRANKAVFLLVDQKTNEGIAVPFFGRDAMTTPLPAALALKLGAVVLPISNERLGGTHFRMAVHPPIEFAPAGDHDRDVYALTLKINEAIERLVRHRPSQWLWIHRRWPKPGDKPRSRRGLEAQVLAGAGVRAESDGSSAT
jgi:KDO2-lipid IV(A) lauroyltransferase